MVISKTSRIVLDNLDIPNKDKMLSTLIWLSVIGSVMGNDMLVDSMSGLHGGNRILVCAMAESGAEAGAGAGCEGALVATHFVFLRASCLQGKALHTLRLVRSKEPRTCLEFSQGAEWNSMRMARRRFVHPQFSQAPDRYDAALVLVDQAYYSVDELLNTTAMYTHLNKLEPWVISILKEYPISMSQKKVYYQSNPLTSPEQMFLMAVVLPTVSFILFFLFITSSNKTKSYKTLEEDKEDASVI